MDEIPARYAWARGGLLDGTTGLLATTALECVASSAATATATGCTPIHWWVAVGPCDHCLACSRRRLGESGSSAVLRV